MNICASLAGCANIANTNKKKYASYNYSNHQENYSSPVKE